jgi:hypothetical protein
VNEWLKTWSPLSLGVLLLVVAIVALVRERLEAAWLFGGLGSLMLGVFIAVELHDRWHDDDKEG